MNIHKRILGSLPVFLLVLLVFWMLPQTVQAADAEDLTFRQNSDGTYTVYDCSTSATGALEIPATYNDMPVTVIGKNAFSGCSQLTSIILPDSVTKIEYNAFERCTNLTSIHIPEGMTSIGENAFYNCKSLTSIAIPKSVTAIGPKAFQFCDSMEAVYITDLAAWCQIDFSDYYSTPVGGAKLYLNGTLLTEAVFPQGITKIGANTFAHCDTLKSIVLPSDITSIEDYAFYGCEALESIVLPQGVTAIGNSAFSDCTALESIVLPQGLTAIGKYAFSYCSVLKSVSFPDSVKTIGNSAFYGCTAIESIVIPKGVTELSDNIFYNCRNLKSVTLPQGVTQIRSSAFCGCYNLTSVNLPDSITSIRTNAFYGCSLLDLSFPDSITYVGKDAVYQTKWLESQPDGMIYIGKVFYQYKGDCPETVIIPDGTLSIAPYALAGKNSLLSVTIPEGVVTIGERAFSSCEALTSIVIPAGVTTIETYAFAWSDNMTEVTLPDSITRIDNYAFHCSGLTRVNITDVSAWCSISFGGYYANPLSHAQNLYVNDTLLTHLVIDQDVTSLGEYVFAGATCIKTVTAGDTVSIASSAFYNCEVEKLIVADWSKTVDYKMAICQDTLRELVISEGVTSIGYCVFDDYKKLESIHFSEGLTTIGYEAFAGCTGLKTLTLPNSLTSISGGAFQGCTGLESVSIAKGVTIGQKAFQSCTGLKSVSIAKGVTSIGKSAFLNCTNLTTLTLPDGLSSFENYYHPFKNCSIKKLIIADGSETFTGTMLACPSTLEEIVIPASVKSITATFEGCPKLSAIRVDENNTCYKNDAQGSFLGIAPATLIRVPIAFSGTYRFAQDITVIADYAFANCTGIQELIISDRIQSIGENAFVGCNIKKLIIEDGSTAITNAMVVSEDTLECFVIPDSVTTIGDSAFSGCSALTSISLPDSVTTIGKSAFSGCSALTSIHIPDSVTTIGDSTFSGCSALTSISLPDGVTTIGAYAFSGCSALTSVQIPKGAQVGKFIFSGCSSLEEVQMPYAQYVSYGVNNRVFKYGFGVFFSPGATDQDAYIEVEHRNFQTPNGAYAPNFFYESYYVPKSLRSVTIHSGGGEEYVFQGFHMLTHITLLNESQIENYAFLNCTSLTTLTLADRAIDVSRYAFSNCSNLQYNIYDTGKYLGNEKNPYVVLIEAVSESVTTCQLPLSIRSTKESAFANTTLTQVILPRGFETITQSAMRYLSSANQIVIPDSVTTIEYGAFSYWSKLKTVYYTGTQSQWRAITIEGNNSYLTGAAIQYDMRYVTYKDWDGTILHKEMVHSGDPLTYTAQLTREADNTYTYTYTGWDQSTCTGDLDVTAVYKATYIDYTVTFCNWDGTVLQSSTYHYNDPITAPADPTRVHDAVYYYEFAGWDSEVSNLCDGNKTYTAQYDRHERTTPATPGKPTLRNITPSVVTLGAVEGCEYSKDGVTWQDSHLFTGLTANTQYTFYQRIKETRTALPSQQSPGLTVTTPKKTECSVTPVKPVVVECSATRIVLLAREGYEYRIGNSNWRKDPTFVALQENTTYTFSQRIAETGDEYASAVSQSITVKTGSSGVTSADYYIRLRQHVAANATSDNGKWFEMTDSGNGAIYTYRLTNQNDGVTFSLVRKPTSSTGFEVTTMFNLNPDKANVSVSCTMVYKSGGQVMDIAVDTSIPVVKSKYTTDTNLYSSESGLRYISSSDFSEMATMTMRLLCVYWDSYLFSRMDFGLNALGFASFNGMGATVCDLSSNYHCGSELLRDQRDPSCGLDGYTGNYYCSACGLMLRTGSAIPSTSAHSYDNSCDGECNTCKEQRKVQHTFDSGCDTICNQCGFVRVTGAEHNMEDQICTVCGQNQCESFGHQWSEATCTTAKTCTVCQLTDGEPLGHKGQWETVVPGDCTVAAVLRWTCDVCGETQTKTEPAPGHNFQTDITEPTCSQTGTKVSVCTVCGHTETESLPTAPHTYSGDCFEQCNICGFVRTPPAEHTFTSPCDEICDVCGKVTEPREEHSFGTDHICTACGKQNWIIGDYDGNETIDNADVEYLLWHTLFPEDYPLPGSGDVTGDGGVDNQDVEYLLWYTLFPEDYPLTLSTPPRKKEF